MEGPTQPSSQGLTPVQVQFPAQTPVYHQFPPQSSVVPAQSTLASSSSSSSSKSLPDHLMYKNRLQEYTQRSGIPLPVYQTINEGCQRSSYFRSSVLVDGACYTSPNLFPSRKAAEQDVAMLALSSMPERIKDTRVPALHEVAVFCKTILNEYAMKRNVENPTYNTVHQKASPPVFISSLVFNGVSYTGDTGKSKKEAEQLAARAAIESLLGDSESRPVLAEIVKSKSKLTDALYKIKDPHNAHANLVPLAVSIGPSSSISTNAPIIAIPEAPPHHEFIKRILENPNFQEISLPITFVPAVYQDSVTIPFGVAHTSLGMAPTHLGVSSTALGISRASKKRRKNKKKYNKTFHNNAQFPVGTLRLNQPAPCSVSQ